MISLRNLHYRYSGNPAEALRGIDLDIHEGECIAIIGSNGSGKSTLARCLDGLLQPTSGSVTVDGISTGDLENLPKVRRKVGMVFQDPNLQMTSVTVERELAFGLENLAVDPAEIHQRVDSQLKVMDLERYRSVSPSTLSGGERQRLAIASVLVLQPRYLILDEATAYLSAKSRKIIIDLLLDRHSTSGIGIIMITQFPGEAILADRLIVLHAGQVAYDDAPSRVLEKTEELIALGVPVPIRNRLLQLL